MSHGEGWTFLLKVRIAASLVLVDHFPGLVEQRQLRGEAIEIATVARWFDCDVPTDIERWRRPLDRLVSSAPCEALLEARNQRSLASIDRHDDALAGVNIGPGRRSTNDLAVAAAVDASLSGARAVALAWNELGADLTSLVDVEAALGSHGPISADSAEQTRLIIEAWGPGAKGVVTVRTENAARMRVVNVINDAGTPVFLDYTSAYQLTALASVKSNVDPITAGEEAIANIVTSSPFTSARLWRTADLPGAQGLPDSFFDSSPLQRRDLLAARIATELDCHPCPEAMLDEVVRRVDYFGEAAYTRWLIRQIQLGALTLLPGQLREPQLNGVVPLTAVDGALIDFATCGKVIEHRGGFEIALADSPEIHRRLEFFDGVLLRSGAVDGLEEGSIEVRIPHDSQNRLTVADRIYEPPLPALHSEAVEPRSFSWIDINRALSPGSRKTNCWYVASAVGTYLSTGAVSIALPKYDRVEIGDSVTSVPAYLDYLGAGPAQFVVSKTEAEEVVRGWGPGQHGIVAASLNSDSTHMFNVFFDGKDVRFIDGYAGIPGDSQFSISWERIGICHLGPLDYRFLRPVPI